MTKDFDLCHGSLWYTKLPPDFPVPSMSAQDPCSSTYSYSWDYEFGGMKKELVASCRWTDDMSITKVRVTWKDKDPIHTVKAEQKHIPPPAPLSEEELDLAHKSYGQNIATWCETSTGLSETANAGHWFRMP